jgi:putative membrane protein
MKKLLPMLLIMIALLSCQYEHGVNYGSSKGSPDALTFVKGGIEGNLTEVNASGLVITNSNNQHVIGFAKLMLDDHTNADSGLMKIEADMGIEANDTISAIHQQMISDLSKKSGAAFDRQYMQMMVTDHEAAVQLFTKGSTNADAGISKFASGVLPIIKMHLDSAKRVLALLK